MIWFFIILWSILGLVALGKTSGWDDNFRLELQLPANNYCLVFFLYLNCCGGCVTFKAQTKRTQHRRRKKVNLNF